MKILKSIVVTLAPFFEAVTIIFSHLIYPREKLVYSKVERGYPAQNQKRGGQNGF